MKTNIEQLVNALMKQNKKRRKIFASVISLGLVIMMTASLALARDGFSMELTESAVTAEDTAEDAAEDNTTEDNTEDTASETTDDNTDNNTDNTDETSDETDDTTDNTEETGEEPNEGEETDENGEQPSESEEPNENDKEPTETEEPNENDKEPSETEEPNEEDKEPSETEEPNEEDKTPAEDENSNPIDVEKPVDIESGSESADEGSDYEDDSDGYSGERELISTGSNISEFISDVEIFDGLGEEFTTGAPKYGELYSLQIKFTSPSGNPFSIADGAYVEYQLPAGVTPVYEEYPQAVTESGESLIENTENTETTEDKEETEPNEEEPSEDTETPEETQEVEEAEKVEETEETFSEKETTELIEKEIEEVSTEEPEETTEKQEEPGDENKEETEAAEESEEEKESEENKNESNEEQKASEEDKKESNEDKYTGETSVTYTVYEDGLVEFNEITAVEFTVNIPVVFNDEAIKTFDFGNGIFRGELPFALPAPLATGDPSSDLYNFLIRLEVYEVGNEDEPVLTATPDLGSETGTKVVIKEGYAFTENTKYKFALRFAEGNNQFAYDNGGAGFLTYQLPGGIVVSEEKITKLTVNDPVTGLPVESGSYSVNTDELVQVRFGDHIDPDDEQEKNYIDIYTSVVLTLDIFAEFEKNNDKIEIDFGNNIHIDIDVEKPAGKIELDKTGSMITDPNKPNHRAKYSVKATAKDNDLTDVVITDLLSPNNAINSSPDITKDKVQNVKYTIYNDRGELVELVENVDLWAYFEADNQKGNGLKLTLAELKRNWYVIIEYEVEFDQYITDHVNGSEKDTYNSYNTTVVNRATANGKYNDGEKDVDVLPKSDEASAALYNDILKKTGGTGSANASVPVGTGNIEWKVTVGDGKTNIGNILVTDTFGDGLELVKHTEGYFGNQNERRVDVTLYIEFVDAKGHRPNLTGTYFNSMLVGYEHPAGTVPDHLDGDAYFNTDPANVPATTGFNFRIPESVNCKTCGETKIIYADIHYETKYDETKPGDFIYTNNVETDLGDKESTGVNPGVTPTLDYKKMGKFVQDAAGNEFIEYEIKLVIPKDYTDTYAITVEDDLHARYTDSAEVGMLDVFNQPEDLTVTFEYINIEGKPTTRPYQMDDKKNSPSSWDSRFAIRPNSYSAWSTVNPEDDTLCTIRYKIPFTAPLLILDPTIRAEVKASIDKGDGTLINTPSARMASDYAWWERYYGSGKYDEASLPKTLGDVIKGYDLGFTNTGARNELFYKDGSWKYTDSNQYYQQVDKSGSDTGGGVLHYEVYKPSAGYHSFMNVDTDGGMYKIDPSHGVTFEDSYEPDKVELVKDSVRITGPYGGSKFSLIVDPDKIIVDKTSGKFSFNLDAADKLEWYWVDIEDITYTEEMGGYYDVMANSDWLKGTVNGYGKQWYYDPFSSFTVSYDMQVVGSHPLGTPVHNEAGFWIGGNEYFLSDDCDLETGSYVVDKKMEHDKDTRIADFTIDINPLKEDLASGTDYYEITDDMSGNLMLYTQSIEIQKWVDNGNGGGFVKQEPNEGNNPQTLWTFTVDESNNIITFIVPDNEYIRIVYKVLISGGAVDSNGDVYLENTVEVAGHFTDKVGGTFPVSELGGGGLGDKTAFLLLKQDEYTNLPLSGAVFALYASNQSNALTDSALTALRPGNVAESIRIGTSDIKNTQFYFIGYGTTNSAGQILFKNSYLTDRENQTPVYALVELKAPNGYEQPEETATNGIISPDSENITLFAYREGMTFEGYSKGEGELGNEIGDVLDGKTVYNKPNTNDITLKKLVVGSTDDKNKKFDFEFTFLNCDIKGIKVYGDKSEGEVLLEAGTDYQIRDTGLNVVLTVSLGHEESIRVTKPDSVDFIVREIKLNGESYTYTSSVTTGITQAEPAGGKANYTGDPTGTIISNPNENVYVEYINILGGPELPNAGSGGMLVYTVTGATLMTMALFVTNCTRRRRNINSFI